MRSAVTFASLALALSLAAPPAARAQITRGPFVQDVRTQSGLVVWEGGALADPQVGYGLTAADQQFVSATCQGVHCVAKLPDLAPDTAYTYAVYSGGTVVSPEGTLHTQPAEPRPFGFVVYGDNRSDPVAHQKVVDGILEVGGFEFLLNTGDMVSSGEVESQWDEFFAIEAELLRSTPVYPGIGNHEEHDGKAEIAERLFHPPSAASGSKSRHYYSFDWGNSHFIAIDGEINVLPWWLCIFQGKAYDGCLDDDQRDWLNDDLDAAAADPDIEHVFVFMHQGPYSSKEGRTGSGNIRDLLPLFAQSKVKLVISGHDHYYEHGISGNGLHYMISGGGGAPLYKTEPNILNGLWPHQILKSISVHNFQHIQVTGSLIEVTAYNSNDGSQLDGFVIGSSPDCGVAADCVDEEPGVCVGEWACSGFKCVWECAPPPPCLTAADCPEPPAGTCAGHWECPITLQCQWACDDVAECSADADCADKQPLNACEGGHYACETEVCEWVCEGPIPPDAAPDAAPDAGPDAAPEAGPEPAPEPAPEAVADASPAPDEAADAAVAPEADTADEEVSAPEADAPTPDAPAPGPDATPEGPGTGGEGEIAGGGCHGGAPAGPWGWLLALATCLALARRRPARC